MTVPVDGAGAGDGPEHEAEDEPRGTLLLMVLFLLGIAATFVWMYLTLLERS